MLAKGGRTSWIILFTIWNLSIYGQTNDSLFLKLELAKDYVDSVRVYLNLSDSFKETDTIQLGLHYANLASRLAAAEKNDTLKIQSLERLVYYYRQLERTDSLMIFGDSLTQLAIKNGDKSALIKIYKIKSSWYLKTFQPDSSLFYHQKLLGEIADEPTDAEYSYAYYGIGHVYFVVKLKNQAKFYLNHAIRNAKAHGHSYALMYAADALAILHKADNLLDSAQYFTKLHYHIADSLQDDFEKGLSLELQARIAIQKGQFDLADQVLSKAFELISKTEEAYLGDVYLTRGKLLYEQGDYKGALKVVSIGNSYLSGINKRDESKAFRDLYKIYDKLGDYEMAYHYRDRFGNFQDTTNAKLLENQFQVLEMDYQLASKDRKLEILALKGEQQQQRLTSITQWLIIVLLLILLIGVYATHLSYKNRQNIRQKAILEDEVNARTQELKAVNRQLGNYVEELQAFNFITSHDIKEPVRNINSFTQLLFRNLRSDLSEENNQFFSYLKGSIRQLNQLIEGIESYATVESKFNGSVEIDQINIMELPTQIKLRLEELITEKNASLYFNGFDLEYKVPTGILVVLEHLVRNSLQYCKDLPPRVECQISKSDQEKKWIFYVRDNGIGIDPKFHDHIFQMFKRLNNRKEFQGSGLGLAICKKIISRLGGTIKLKSTIGEGAEFYFTLPIKE